MQTFDYKGFTHEELQKAFELIQNKEHWKNSIDSVCASEEIKVIAAAIVFFTATKPVFDYLCEIEQEHLDGNSLTDEKHKRFKIGDHIFKVRSLGYRQGPAGDH